ncbi:Protein of unknown function (DUF1212) [Seminavis robusta]|uniref:Threonine/serine exporter-like N-terminal domain-containing protein n=1 Tax=Seminavis robusta TaxID=568900 RepID=A0A9N8EMV8_9STRA|nr:Protein of unknown function (DUF1212) [Seminavis robusta]|eukprot:Sro1573_g283470.1 Protein of unknown function (DUF1212) (531) ;mRNA; r:19994-21586
MESSPDVPVVTGLEGEQQDFTDVWLFSHDGHDHSIDFVEEDDDGDEVHIDHNETIDSKEPTLETGVALDVSSTADDSDDDLEAGALVHADFNATCRFAARFGAAAINNGSIAENLERFLPRLMSVFGYYGFFTFSTHELSCNFEQRDPLNTNETIVRTQNVAVEAGGFQLTKLGQLSDLAKDLIDGKIGIQEANKRLDEIETAPNPWGIMFSAICFLAVGATLPALLAGTWWDMLVGFFAGGLAYGVIVLFDAWSTRVHIWMNLVAAFLCSTLGFAVQLVRPEVDPTIVTLSGVAILLPSSTIVLGINDMVSNHVISGFERLIKGLVIMTWLALGYVLGMSFVTAMAPEMADEAAKAKMMMDTEPIPFLWQLLFIPILCSSIATCGFQMTGRDLIGAIICMNVGYATSYFGIRFFDAPYVGSFMGSIAISLYANLWSRYFDRPNTIILFPAFQLVVAGIVGFMGLTQIFEGTGGGHEQVLHMLVVAGVVVPRWVERIDSLLPDLKGPDAGGNSAKACCRPNTRPWYFLHK